MHNNKLERARIKELRHANKLCNKKYKAKKCAAAIKLKAE